MSAASPTTPPLLHGRYRVVARLGESRLATVYQAQDERLKRMVLVHILRQELAAQPSLRQRFEEEARRGAQRSHPGLLEVYDSGEVGGRPYMVTEAIDGQSLAEAGVLSPATALGVVRTVVGAIALSQAQGLPHPPVSSQNVWLLTGGRVVLLENWRLSPGEVAADLAVYRAPERARGAPPSPSSSVYALGILAWEAFVGRRPFDATTPEAILRQQYQIPVISAARPSIFSPELDRIVGQATAPDPSLRYPAPIDFARALDQYADAVSAQTGRLAALPTARAEPSTFRRQLQRVSRRRATQAAPAVAPPPPPPVIREMPPQTQTIVPAPQVDQRQIDRQIEREVRRQMRRQGCRRAILRRSLQLALAFLVLYGIYLGVRYAYDYATGQLARFQPGEWVSRQIPDLNELLPAWLRDPGATAATYRVVQPINLRSAPTATDATTIVRVLSEGTLVQQVGPPQPDATGQPYEWIEVIVLDSGERGWIANLQGRLERR